MDVKARQSWDTLLSDSSPAAPGPSAGDDQASAVVDEQLPDTDDQQRQPADAAVDAGSAKKFSQADLDKYLEKRLIRERRRFQEQLAAVRDGSKSPDAADADARVQDLRQQLADARRDFGQELVRRDAMQALLAANVLPVAAADAVKLLLDDVELDNDGQPTVDLAEAARDFLKGRRHMTAAPVTSGGSGSSQGTGNSPVCEPRFDLLDPTSRRASLAWSVRKGKL